MHENLLKHYSTLILVLFLSLFATQAVHATHLVGGSLNYEYLGPNGDGTYAYRVYSVTYTDTASSNFDEPEFNIPVAIYENASGSPSSLDLVTQFNMPRVSTSTIVLEGLTDGCTVGNDIGIKRAEYEFFVDLPLNFDGYWLFYDRCCRNDEVVNLFAEQGVGFSTYLPSPLVENSSPFFNADPTPFLCVNDTSTFLNSAVDPDGDLLVFSFINPYRGYSTAGNPNPGAGGGYPNQLGWEVPTVNYVPGFSASEPFGSGSYAFINGSTGLTSYMSPIAGQFAVAVEIKEYRNGNLIGIVRRDLQLVVINCPPNPAPDLSNQSAGNDGPTEWLIDEGETLCFPVIFDDVNGDSLTLNAFGEVFDPIFVTPSATINTPIEGEATVQADFCWSTDCSQGRDVPYFFGVTASDNGCPPKSASEIYTVQITPFTGSSFLNGAAQPCEGSVETYTTDVFTGGSYDWTVTGGTIISGDGTESVTVEWGSPGTGNIIVAATNFRGCLGEPWEQDFPIQPLPVIDAGTDIEICLGDTISIGGSPTGPSGSVFVWGPDAEIDDTGAENPNVYPTADTFYEVNVISLNSCSARDTINILVNEPQLMLSGDTEICLGSSAPLLASGAVSYQWSPSDGLSQDDIANPDAAPLTTTTYTVNSVDANTCEAEATLTVDVFEVPVTEAGQDQSLCGLITILAPEVSVGEGTWTGPAGISFNDPNNPTTTVTTSLEGIFELTWTEVNGGICSDQDMVMIEFVDQPVSNAGSDDLACSLDYTLAALSSAGNGAWEPVTDITFTDANDPVTPVVASAYGQYELTWIETNQFCADTAMVMIQFAEQPVADAGPDDSVCGQDYILSAAASVGDGMWTGPSGVTFDDPSNPNSDVSSVNYGAQELTWMEDNEGCTSQSTLDVTFIEIPVSDAGMDDELCGLEYQLQGTPSVGTGTWNMPMGVTITDPSNAITNTTADNYGPITFTWTEDNDGCVDQSSVTIDFLEVPVPDAGSDTEVCIESSVDLLATGGDSYLWTPGESLDADDIANPSASPTVETLYTVVVSLNNGCSSEDQVNVIVHDLPTVSAGEDVGYLCTADSVQLQATEGYEEYSWSPDIGLSADDIPNPVAAPNTAIIIDYIVTVTDINDCQNSDTVRVTVNPIVPTDAGPDTLICQGEPVVLGGNPTAPDGTTYTWNPDQDIDDINAANPTVTPTVTTTYQVQTDNSICTGGDQVTVIVEETPDMNYNVEAVPGCEGLLMRFQNLGDANLAYTWSFGDGDSSMVVSPSHLFSFGTQYDITLIGVSDLDCTYEISGVIDAENFESYFDVRMPNVITPNNDQENDVLDINVIGQISECLQMEVFNRWGQVVFRSEGNNTRWDGRTPAGELVNPGVYFYYVDLNGATYKGSVQVLY